MMQQSRFMVICILGLMMVACAGRTSIQVESSVYRVQAELEQVGLGKRPIVLTITTSTGAPVVGAQVEILPIMEQHGMLSPPLTLQETAPGVYMHPELDLTMSGEWQLKLAITRADDRRELILPVVIE
jgi:hypothetical protein